MITISVWDSVLTVGASLLTSLIVAFITGRLLFKTEIRLPTKIVKRKKRGGRNFTDTYLTWLSGINTDVLETSDGMDMAAVGRLPTLQATFSFDNQDQRTQAHLDLPTALHQFRRLLIVGQAGAGKSSLLRYIAAAASTPSGRRVLGIHHTVVPLLVTLSATDLPLLDPRVPSSLLTHVVPPHLTPPNEFPKEHLRKGRCLVLIDGLDQIVHGKDRRLVARLITSLANEFPTNQYIVATRPCTETNRLHDFAKLSLETPSYADYVRAVGELFLEEEATDAQAGELPHAAASHTAKRDAEEFIQLIITGDEELRQLTSDPFWFSLAASAYRQRGVIPKGRVQLMEDNLQFVLSYWDESRGVAAQVDGNTKIKVVSELAFWMQQNGIDLAWEDQVLAAFQRALDLDSQPVELAKELLRTIQTRSGLLVEQGESLIGFAHRTIQEYLAARYIVLASDGTGDMVDLQRGKSWGAVVQLSQDIRKAAQEGRIQLS